MTWVNIPLKHDERQGGKRFGSYKSSSNDQGNKHANKRLVSAAEKAMQQERHVQMVKGLLFGMKLTKMPAAEWNKRYAK